MIIFTALHFLWENVLNTGIPEEQNFAETSMLQFLCLLCRIYLHESPPCDGASNLDPQGVLFSTEAARV